MSVSFNLINLVVEGNSDSMYTCFMYNPLESLVMVQELDHVDAKYTFFDIIHNAKKKMVLVLSRYMVAFADTIGDVYEMVSDELWGTDEDDIRLAMGLSEDYSVIMYRDDQRKTPMLGRDDFLMFDDDDVYTCAAGNDVQLLRKARLRPSVMSWLALFSNVRCKPESEKWDELGRETYVQLIIEGM